mmetsp:Transcript_7914/g.13963  ORF Transcript_7914/g.13963 Transcript_7914/m.13963 type:complete len:98 (-) Transcript_7914:185-478(-)
MKNSADAFADDDEFQDDDGHVEDNDVERQSLEKEEDEHIPSSGGDGAITSEPRANHIRVGDDVGSETNHANNANDDRLASIIDANNLVEEFIPDGIV